LVVRGSRWERTEITKPAGEMTIAFCGGDNAAMTSLWRNLRVDDAYRMPASAPYRWLIPVADEKTSPIAFVQWWPRSIGDAPCAVAPAIESFHDASRRIVDVERAIEVRSPAEFANAIDATVTVGAPMQ